MSTPILFFITLLMIFWDEILSWKMFMLCVFMFWISAIIDSMIWYICYNVSYLGELAANTWCDKILYRAIIVMRFWRTQVCIQLGDYTSIDIYSIVELDALIAQDLEKVSCLKNLILVEHILERELANLFFLEEPGPVTCMPLV